MCSIYIELADQYKAIDATSNVAKRNVLAEHLQDVIRVLERKVRLSTLSSRRYVQCLMTYALLG